uniref:hypothetical protein n=1 Tax=Enterobacter asburiae TaxID=61645 RepID=UPI001595EA19|nr:hypothetical protein [Enterobacter asburiae]BEK81512.1 hypothetical protein EATA8330_44070 [Enterobacter asburiae]
MNLKNHTLLKFILFFILFPLNGCATDVSGRCLIYDNSIGLVKLNAKIVDYLTGKEISYTKEKNAEGIFIWHLNVKDFYSLDAVVNSAGRVIYIETFDVRCKNKWGIHPGMTLMSAGDIMGGGENKYSTEIEMRQYVTFKKKSPQIFRVKANSEYSEDSILSIGISSNRSLAGTE